MVSTSLRQICICMATCYSTMVSYERYNGILGNQPNSNKVIEPQLMQRFIRENYSISLSCPNEFREEFAKFDLPDRIIESVRETLMSDNVDKVILPSKYNRKVIDRTSQENICMLYCKIYPNTRIDEIIVNSIIMKYESVCFKGKTFSISRNKDVPYIVQAKWNETCLGLHLPHFLDLTYQQQTFGQLM